VENRKAANVTVARIVRPHGRRGEVASEILTDFPQRLTKLKAAELWDGRSAPKSVPVLSCWLSHSRGGQAIFHFENSNSISDAEKLVGLEVQIPFTDRMVLPSTSYYISDLVGCEVFSISEASAQDGQSAGLSLGRVTDVESHGEAVTGTPLLTVRGPKGEFLLPLAQNICVRIDTAASRIDAVIPEGLLEIND
jgi:16S rRNA processing protein RimM